MDARCNGSHANTAWTARKGHVKEVVPSQSWVDPGPMPSVQPVTRDRDRDGPRTMKSIEIVHEVWYFAIEPQALEDHDR